MAKPAVGSAGDGNSGRMRDDAVVIKADGRS
jgi:hypothetical protein